MTEKSKQNQETSENDASGILYRDFATALGSILESASSVFPVGEDLEIKFSVALVGEMGKEEFSNLVRELPVVAGIALGEEIGRKAAILTDISTAAVLAGLISTGEPSDKDALSEKDLGSLSDALSPMFDALSNACERALGEPLGSLENVEVADPESQQSLLAQLSETLCRATASVRIGNEESGRIIFVLPLDLAEALAALDSTIEGAEVSAREQAELQQQAGGIEVSEYEQAELQQEDEDVLQPHTAGTSESGMPSAYAQVERTPEPSAPEAPRRPEVSPEYPVPNIDLILDIQLKLTARLGQVEMPVGEILKLAPGSVIDIDRFVDEPVDLVVNDRLIARGEIVVVQENFGIRITEIISTKERIKSLR